jgi:membrane protein DedA with SNARE-associated domain
VHYVMSLLLHTNPLLIYLIVAVILLLESSGVPIVNNTLLLLTGALASLGQFNIWALAAAAIVGSITGACLAYFIGAYGGRNMLFLLAKWLHIEHQKIFVVERWFQKSGLWMVFLSRMIPYARPFACFPAGMTHTNFAYFFIMALSGSIIWCSVLLSIGWHLGRRWVLAVQMMHQYTVPALCIIAILIAIYGFVMYTIKRRLQNSLRAEKLCENDMTRQEDHNLIEA